MQQCAIEATQSSCQPRIGSRREIYVWMGVPDVGGCWRGYVGMTKNLKQRIRQHEKKHDALYRSLLIKRDTKHGFTTSEIGSIEEWLYDKLSSAANVDLVNTNRPIDGTLPGYQHDYLRGDHRPCGTDADHDGIPSLDGRRVGAIVR